MKGVTFRFAVPMAIAAAAAVAGCATDSSRLETTTPAPAVTTGTLRAAVAAPVPARRAEAVKVGLMLPLSGPGQAGLIADALKRAAEMGLAEARTPHVQLVIRDDKATPDGALAAMRELVGEKVEIVLGPLFSRSVQAAAPVANQANVPMVAFSNDRQVAGQNVSLLSFLVEPEVQRVVAHAAAKGRKRHVALLPSDSYGRLAEAAYRAAAARHGVTIVAVESYAPDTAHAVADAVRKLRDALRGIEEHGDPVDALFLPGGEETLSLLTPQLKAAGIDTRRLQVIGTGAMDYPTAGRDGVLVGAWFAAPDPKGWTDFASRYGRLHGHAPPRIAALAYDAVVLATSLSNGADGARYIPSGLTRASGFEGVDGTFRLAADGTADRGLAVLEVKADGATMLEPAVSIARNASPPPAGAGVGAAASAPTERGFLSSIPSAFPPVN